MDCKTDTYYVFQVNLIFSMSIAKFTYFQRITLPHSSANPQCYSSLSFVPDPGGT